MNVTPEKLHRLFGDANKAREIMGLNIRIAGEVTRIGGKNYLLTRFSKDVPGVFSAVEVPDEYNPKTATGFIVGPEVTIFDPESARAVNVYVEQVAADPDGFLQGILDRTRAAVNEAGISEDQAMVILRSDD